MNLMLARHTYAHRHRSTLHNLKVALIHALTLLYGEYKRNKWLHHFAVFCRIALALGFIPSGYVKVMGERFTALPSNHPLGHYFDALYLTGYYYTFVGIGQLSAALLLLIPRTALLGAVAYFPIILNIVVLDYATRFEGTRIATFMLLANLFLLVWDYDRLSHILPFGRPDAVRYVPEKNSKFPVLFFAGVFATLALVVALNLLYDIRPGNSKLECTNGCPGNGRPEGCLNFCNCIYEQGNPLQTCLREYESSMR
jgi:uncharacterized membrane protein YphA (DoxX/SURF4 family)